MAEIGREGGKVKSDAKAATSAENGKKGGRPKKKATK
jgi:general stress protein YciG